MTATDFQRITQSVDTHHLLLQSLAETRLWHWSCNLSGQLGCGARDVAAANMRHACSGGLELVRLFSVRLGKGLHTWGSSLTSGIKLPSGAMLSSRSRRAS